MLDHLSCPRAIRWPPVDGDPLELDGWPFVVVDRSEAVDTVEKLPQRVSGHQGAEHLVWPVGEFGVMDSSKIIPAEVVFGILVVEQAEHSFEALLDIHGLCTLTKGVVVSEEHVDKAVTKEILC